MLKYTNMPYTPRKSNNLKRGGIIKYIIRNETSFIGTGLPITLPNCTDEQCAASVWSTRSPNDPKFQREFDAKRDKGVDVVYDGTTIDSDKNNSSLDYWRKGLSNSISNIGLDSIFHVEVNIK